MKILFASSSFVSIPIVDALIQRQSSELNAGIELLGIISNPDARSGRGLRENENVIVEKYKAEIPIYQPTTHEELKNLLLELQPDLVVTCAYGRLIKAESLQIPRFGWLNLHFSLLPRWRGAAPVQWGLLSGDLEFGFSIFKLNEGMDTGAIIHQEKVAIDDEACRDEVLLTISQAATHPLLEVISHIESLELTPQSNEGVTLATKITKEQGLIHWNTSSQAIFNQFRALSSDPGIFTNFEGNRIVVTKLSRAFTEQLTPEMESALSTMQPGEFFIPSKSSAHGCVKTSDGFLLIHELKPAGKKAMSCGDFVRGLRLSPYEIRQFS